jgi:hypothetical protein
VQRAGPLYVGAIYLCKERAVAVSKGECGCGGGGGSGTIGKDGNGEVGHHPLSCLYARSLERRMYYNAHRTHRTTHF